MQLVGRLGKGVQLCEGDFRDRFLHLNLGFSVLASIAVFPFLTLYSDFGFSKKKQTNKQTNKQNRVNGGIAYQCAVRLRSSRFRFLLANRNTREGHGAKRSSPPPASNFFAHFRPMPSRVSRLAKRKRKRLLHRLVCCFYCVTMGIVSSTQEESRGLGLWLCSNPVQYGYQHYNMQMKRKSTDPSS